MRLGCFFERGLPKASKTWNLKYVFTLIGIGAGAAWIFSVFWNVYFLIFSPINLKQNRVRTCIFLKQPQFILTLVLLGGQATEARAPQQNQFQL